MNAQDYFEFLLSERKRQNAKLDFTVDYCYLLCRYYFKEKFDEQIFKELSNSKKGNFVLFEINSDNTIIFRGSSKLKRELSKYEREESDFFVDQFCEADAVMQYHSRIYIDGKKYPLKEAVVILNLTKKTFYNFVPTIGKQYEVNGHIVERVLIQ